MARIGIQYEDVKHAAIHLLSQGIAPSVQKIREKLSTGSNTTIAEHLNLWREEYATKEIHHLPANMPKELISAIEVLWQSAMEQAANQLTVTKKALVEQQENLQQEKQLMIQRAADLEKRLEEHQQQLGNKDQQLQALKTEHAVLQERLARQFDEIQQLKQQHESRLKQLYDEMHATRDQLTQTQAEAKKHQQQLHEQTEKHQAALTFERQRQEESENRWLIQIDQARTELQHFRKEHEDLINKKQQQIETLKENITDLRERNAACHTALDNSKKHNQDLLQQLNLAQVQHHDALTQLLNSKTKNEADKKTTTKKLK